MLSYREIAPIPSLDSIVQSCWTLRGDAEPQRIVPDGHPELILNLGAPFEALRDGRWELQPRCFLAGQIAGPLLLRPTGPADIVGIRFHPEGAARIFGDRMEETSGEFIPLDDLAPHGDPAALQQNLVKAARWRQDLAITAAVRRMDASRGNVDLVQLARDAGLSLRQFERRFSAQVGLAPKLFCRMQRFTHVFRAMSDPGSQWIDAALEAGYYDQSHLIRDCKRLSGHTPANLFGPEADLARHFYSRFGMSHSSNTLSAQSLTMSAR